MSDEENKNYSADIPEAAVEAALRSLDEEEAQENAPAGGGDEVVEISVEPASTAEDPVAGDSAAAGDQPRQELSREELLAALEKARGEVRAARERMLRIAADADNTRKRAIRDRDESIKFGQEGLLRDLLPALDNLERTLAHLPEKPDDPVLKSIREGVEMIQRQFEEILARHKLSSFSALGATFDPARHEALAQQENAEAPEGTVVEELQRGYLLNDRLLRPALVVVARRPGKVGETSGSAPADSSETSEGEE